MVVGPNAPAAEPRCHRQVQQHRRQALRPRPEGYIETLPFNVRDWLSSRKKLSLLRKTYFISLVLPLVLKAPQAEFVHMLLSAKR